MPSKSNRSISSIERVVNNPVALKIKTWNWSLTLDCSKIEMWTNSFCAYILLQKDSIPPVLCPFHALPSDAKRWPERRKFLSVPNNYDRYFFLHSIYLLFHVVKCIQSVGFAITRPRYTGMHNLHMRTVAIEANWATAQKIHYCIWRIKSFFAKKTSKRKVIFFSSK